MSASPWRSKVKLAHPKKRADIELVRRAKQAIADRHPDAPRMYLEDRAKVWRCSVVRAAKRILDNYERGW